MNQEYIKKQDPADFSTNLKFTSRENKSAYVYDKYKPLLLGSVLDVGAAGKYLMNQ